MEKKENRFAALTEKAALWVVGILSALIAFFLSAVSLLHTTAVEVVREGEGVYNVVWDIKERLESVIYYNDNFILNLIVLGLGMLLLFLLTAKVRKIPLRTLQIVLFVWTFLLGTVWVLSSQTCPSEDSFTVTSAALECAQGNFDRLISGQYFKNYPFQLGYVLFNEGVFRFISLFKHPDTVMALEVLNAFFLAMINVLLLSIGAKLFRDHRVDLVTTVLLALSAAPVIDCAFTYGLFPGMAFALLAVYLELKWLIDSKPLCCIGAALSIALAIMLKSNYLIWLIALALVWIVKIPARKKYLMDVLFLAGTVILSMCVQPAVKRIYEKRTDFEFGDSIPYSSWIAMGLSETDLAPGWYNIYITVSNFEQSGFDAEEAGRRSTELIKERLRYFRENPQYTNDFFYRKIVSQWNETTYQSIWNNTVRYQYKDKNAFAHWVCYEGERPVKRYIDCYAQLVFFCFFLSTLYLLKKKQFLFSMLPVVFLGGFFYQLISEGKAQYIIPYFILMSGYAAFGAVCFYDFAAARIRPDSLLGKLCAAKYPAVPETAAEASADAGTEPEEAAPEASGEAAEPSGTEQETAEDPADTDDTPVQSGKDQTNRKEGAKK
ncbi:MAG: hypothetical protein IKH27_02845 [Oscillospiraceae bacterium]|nr:hypothetical protein [Oscillospiraceae bacterium]